MRGQARFRVARIVATDPSPCNHRESFADEISQFQESRRNLILSGENNSSSAPSIGCVKRTTKCLIGALHAPYKFVTTSFTNEQHSSDRSGRAREIG